MTEPSATAFAIPDAGSQPVHLVMHGIVKAFAGVRALDGVDFEVRGGEVLALVGENGAGKSTLINIIGGRWPAGSYEGSIDIDGQAVSFGGPSEALAAGIAVIHQELQLVPDLSVAENLFLGRLPTRRGMVDPGQLRRQARAVLERYGFDIDPRVPVRRLSVGRRQLVEIARALDRQARILVFDEPSSALTDVETDRLLAIIGELRTSGVATVYISHKLDEVFAIADRITVLRDGRTAGQLTRADATPGKVVRLMVGRELGELYHRTPREPGETRLEIRELTVPALGGRGAPLVDRVSFEVRSGEVVALAGLLGAGRTETLLAIFGALPRDGQVLVEGRPLAAGRIDEAIRAGLCLVTEDRKGTGLVLDFTVRSNVGMANLDANSRGGVMDAGAERRMAEEQARGLQLRPPRIELPAKAFSGGNQQKVVLGKWLARRPRILLLDEPTRGVDVGAKAEIFAIIDRLRADGTAILMVSSDLREVLGAADRIVVLHEGVREAILDARSATQETIMAHATRTSDATGTEAP
jgi:D-xylose transport system ATP-binding protein